MKKSNGERGRFLPGETEILTEYATRWSFLARPGQIPPKDAPWFCYLMRSGRGGGKTRSGSEWVLDRVRQGYRMIALVGKTAADVRDTMVEIGDSAIMQVARPHERPIYEPSKRRLTFPSGAIAIGYNGDEPDQLRGPQHDSAWVDELAKFQYPEETWSNLLFGLRLGANPQVFVTTTPRPIPLIKRLVAAPDTIDVRFSTFENAANLSPIFLEKIRAEYEGTRLGRQELEGEILDDNPYALWQRSTIEHLRVPKAPPLIRIVVGVDPAVTGSETSDETGIVVAGTAADGTIYVLGDYSLRGPPIDWARAVERAYRTHAADRVIGEVNNGGDLVEVNLRTVDPTISFTAVHASRGKLIRAEPVASLYEQGKVHHVGTYPALEDQMCEWVPGDKSPDRCLAAGTTIDTISGPTPIEEVCLGDLVLTRRGYKEVIASGMTDDAAPCITITCSDGKQLTGTPNHQVFTKNRGFIRMDALVWDDALWTEKPSSTMGSPMRGIQAQQVGPEPDISILSSQDTRTDLGEKPFTNRSGLMQMAQFRQAIISTTLTETRRTTPSQIFGASRVGTTPVSILQGCAAMSTERTLTGCALSQKSGTPPKRGTIGTNNTGWPRGRGESQNTTRSAKSAEPRLNRSLSERSSALDSVSTDTMRDPAEIMKGALALYAEDHSTSKNPRNNQHVPVHVVQKCAAGTGPVFNLSVKDAHEFYANGILVHNCDALVWAVSELSQRTPGARALIGGGTVRNW